MNQETPGSQLETLEIIAPSKRAKQSMLGGSCGGLLAASHRGHASENTETPHPSKDLAKHNILVHGPDGDMTVPPTIPHEWIYKYQDFMDVTKRKERYINLEN